MQEEVITGETGRMAPGGGKEGTTNAVAAFHHVVAKGDLERVKDFVLVRPNPFTPGSWAWWS